MEQYIVIVLLIVLALLIVTFYFSSLHKSLKFKVGLQLLTAFAITFFILAIVFNLQFHKDHQKNFQINYFDELIMKFLDDNLKIFILFPQVNYFYEQLIGTNYKTPQNRNKTLENQISMLIYSRGASVIYYIMRNKNTNEYKKSIKVIEERFNQIMQSFLKSPIFKENWYIYNSRLAGEPIRAYFKENFNL